MTIMGWRVVKPELIIIIIISQQILFALFVIQSVILGLYVIQFVLFRHRSVWSEPTLFPQVLLSSMDPCNPDLKWCKVTLNAMHAG